MDIYFLSSDVPLTKTITKLNNGEIDKSAYPMRKLFTSTGVAVKTLTDMFNAIKQFAFSKHKPCLLKGELVKQLDNEPRAGCTDSNGLTQWALLDLDKAQFNSIEEFMKAVGLDKISYISQLSSSHNLYKNEKHNEKNNFLKYFLPQL